jgi:hypothetical protein
VEKSLSFPHPGSDGMDVISKREVIPFKGGDFPRFFHCFPQKNLRK